MKGEVIHTHTHPFHWLFHSPRGHNNQGWLDRSPGHRTASRSATWVNGFNQAIGPSKLEVEQQDLNQHPLGYWCLLKRRFNGCPRPDIIMLKIHFHSGQRVCIHMYLCMCVYVYVRASSSGGAQLWRSPCKASWSCCLHCLPL